MQPGVLDAPEPRDDAAARLPAGTEGGGEGAAPGAETTLDPVRIEPNPFQPRAAFDPVKLAELAASIQTHGVLQPLIVRRHGDGYQLVTGERRWRAARQAGLAEVPVVVKALADREMLEVALVENVQREDIGPLEAAGAYRRLADEFGLTQEEIAQRVGKSRSAIANTMRLLDLPAPIRESVSAGKITEGHARALAGIRDEATRDRTWRKLLEEGGSVREAEQAARRSREAANTPVRPHPGSPETTAPLGGPEEEIPAAGRAAAEQPVRPAPADGIGTLGPAKRHENPGATDHAPGRATTEPSGSLEPAGRSGGTGPANPADPHLREAESRLRHALGTKVDIARGRGDGGTVTIEFYSDADLNRLLDLFGCG